MRLRSDMAKREYSTASGGPVQRACRLRIEGKPYSQVAAALRKEFPECKRIAVKTVEAWGRSGRLWWDTVHEIESAWRAEQMPSASTPEGVDRLSQVRTLIDMCSALFDGKADPEAALRLKEYGVRPDTLLLKLYAEERTLTNPDLLGIPKRATQRVVLLVMEKVFDVLLQRHLVSHDRLTSEAKHVEREVMQAMPTVFGAAAATGTVGSTGDDNAGD